MNQLSIPFAGKVYHYEYPRSFEELNLKQLRKLLPLFPKLYAAYRFFERAKTDEERQAADVILQKLRIKCLWILLDFKWYHFLSRRAFLSMYPDEVAEVLKSTDFLLEQPQLRQPPLQNLKVGSRCFGGPGNFLKRLSGEEFHFAQVMLDAIWELHHSPFSATDKSMKRIELLNQLCWCLYRPVDKRRIDASLPDYDGDHRLVFNRFALEKQARVFHKVPLWQRELIVWWFGQQLPLLVKQYPSVFKAGKEDVKAKKEGWLPVFRALSNKDATKVDAIGKMRLHRILNELNVQAAEYRRMQAKVKAK